jgi:hypothetical protein
MREMIVAQKGLEDLQASRARDGQRIWSFPATEMQLWCPSASALFEEGTRHQKLASCSRFLIRPGGRYPNWKRSSVAAWRRRAALWHRRWVTTCSCASGALTPASP